MTRYIPHTLPRLLVILGITASFHTLPAQAGSDDPSFTTPSGNIICGFHDYPSEGLRCDIKERNDATPIVPMPADCEYDWGNMFEIGRTGEARLECAGDLAANPEDSPPLAYGDVINHYGITCLSEKAGLTCLNREGHGFILSRAKQELR